MSFVQEHLSEWLVALGLLLLVIEIAILGFSTFVLFYVGIATVITGSLMFIGILPESILYALVTIAVLSGVLAAVLWKPLKKMQSQTEAPKAESDLIGLEFDAPAELGNHKTASYRFSGIEWQLKAKQEIPAGSTVKVVKVEVGIMHVEPS